MEKTSQKGLALLAVVVYLGVVTLLSGAFFVAVNRTMDQAGAREAREIARGLAEGGVEKALSELQIDSGYAGEANTALGEGMFSVTVESQGEGAYRLRSTGARAQGRPATVTVEVETVLAGGRVAGLRWLEETVR